MSATVLLRNLARRAAACNSTCFPDLSWKRQLQLPNKSARDFSTMSGKTALCLLADGAEEMEAVITIDILRRAEVDVTVSSITDQECVTCSRSVKICPDAKISDVANKKYDVVILPGGVGYKLLAASSKVGEILKAHESDGRIIAAICAAPSVLKAHDIAKGKKITSYPSVKKDVEDVYNYVEDEIVVTDGNLITSKGPATAYAFGLAIAEKLVGKEKAKAVADGMLYKDYK